MARTLCCASFVTTIAFGVASTLSIANAQSRQTLKDSVLGGITARGRALASYDFAAWHASESIPRPLPKIQGLGLFVGIQSPQGWVISFGELTVNRDTFLVHFLAHPTRDPARPRLEVQRVPTVASPAELTRARALSTALSDFGSPNRPYNMAVLPADEGRLWVYIYPAITRARVYPHGGDVRYLISSDGQTIVQKRQMHSSIIEGVIPAGAAHGMHTAILDDVPEDTDVFYVLTREPKIDERVITSSYVFTVHLDGSITWVHRGEGN